jgi:hypothetical protein
VAEARVDGTPRRIDNDAPKDAALTVLVVLTCRVRVLPWLKITSEGVSLSKKRDVHRSLSEILLVQVRILSRVGGSNHHI